MGYGTIKLGSLEGLTERQLVSRGFSTWGMYHAGQIGFYEAESRLQAISEKLGWYPTTSNLDEYFDAHKVEIEGG